MEQKKPRKTFILLFIAALVLIVIGYYAYQGYFYVKTEDAIVTGDIYKIAPKLSGKLTRLEIEEGSEVEKDQIVAQQEQLSATGPAQLEGLMIRSPISGVILQQVAKEGEVVGAGNTVALVVDKRKLYVQANIEETEAGYIHVGQTVEIKLDMYPG